VLITSFVDDLQPQARQAEALKLNKAIFENNMEDKLREATQGPLKDQADKLRNHYDSLAQALVRPFYDGDHVITGLTVDAAMTLPLDIQAYLSKTIKEVMKVGAAQTLANC
jgi:hypothetical protein